ncbi:hypothetical protein NE237_032490 [Protea cynaroides]|uniref:non-specific serine/threonine protein kinase n=1 Tax=Protea cynaroides TaxID=273540 RepID=A0A9Q0L356_9MAGN|nr:hypothetical protein NE237_032490 [Protea cynaroides]
MFFKQRQKLRRSCVGVVFVNIIVGISFLFTFTFGYTLLPKEEVDALRQIAKKLGKTNWNFSTDPCSGESGWVTLNPAKGFENAVTCNCSSNGTVCHVITIVLKAQNLPGVLPSELVKLPYLQQIDLSRNYLSGTIPPEWGSMQLVSVSLIGNRLSGLIPKEITNIMTLRELTLEYNQLSGDLPLEFGNLINIERILISSNDFTGQLPETLSKLTNLRDFRISDNHFRGDIPSFIQNWTKLKKLVIQASGLEGPIPSEISLLKNLSDMRISDIIGTGAAVPPLNNMTSIKTLILRSCNLIGAIPSYLGEMPKLKDLDLSFNNLTGAIPSSFESFSKLDFMYLTGNLLSGTVPDWMPMKGESIDLSYNNFTLGISGVPSCQRGHVNLFGNPHFGNSVGGIATCLLSFNCPQKWYSLYINCGGREVTINGSTYGADQDTASPSKFFQSGYNWAFSSTGSFLDDDKNIDDYIATNTSRLSMNSQLYTTARLSPLSLTYYGYCLLNGNYTVNLHFAEIMFTNDKTCSSLGRRIFDVYIQGKLVLKDFNIMDEAGGAGKEVIKKFAAVVVSSGTLEIRFYWAGRGTAGIPSRGTYGPLISAISVDPDFVPLPKGGKKKMPAIDIVVIVASIVCFVFLVLAILHHKGCMGCENKMSQDLRCLDLQTGSFTLRQIKAATNNFAVANKIGEGGFGIVYKGLLLDGTVVAVKQLSSKSKQGNREFVNEIGMISALQHPHLVKLYGCCNEGNQLLLVYEYMENNCLARALFGAEECQLKLDWPTRYKICIGIAKGLAHLHEESRLKIIHRDIKATNVLLDKEFNPKISDFGLAKLFEGENTHISTRIAGTFGYMAPEYVMRGYLTDKADVYSFGIVALEIVSGMSNTNFRPMPKEDRVYLLDWALILKEKGSLLEIVDPKLGTVLNKEEVIRLINVALLCTNASPSLRPMMSAVVSMLEGHASVEKFISVPLIDCDDLGPKAVKNHYQKNPGQTMSKNQKQSMSMEGPADSSTSSLDV